MKDPEMGKKAYEERRNKRREEGGGGFGEESKNPKSKADAVFEEATQSVKQQDEIERAVNKPRGPIGALFNGIGHVFGSTPVGKFARTAHTSWKQAEENKRAEHARKDMADRAIEIGILGGAGWVFSVYQKLEILTNPLFFFINWISSLFGHKGALIALRSIKIDHAVYYGICVHSQYSLVFGIILTTISYVLMWRITRLCVRGVKFVFALI